MALTTQTQERIKFHLGYTSPGLPPGDAALMTRALAATRTADAETLLTAQVDRTHRAWLKSELYPDLDGSNNSAEEGSEILYKRLIVGDTNRTDTEFRSIPVAQRRRIYRQECDRLSDILGLNNFNTPEGREQIARGAQTWDPATFNS